MLLHQHSSMASMAAFYQGDHGFKSRQGRKLLILNKKEIYKRLSRCKQLGGLVPVVRLGVPLRCKASKFGYPLNIPPLYKKRTLVNLKSNLALLYNNGHNF